MEGFRRLIKGWLGKIMLGAVVFVFVIYGAESLMVLATKPKPVAEINGEEISKQELDARVEQYRQQQTAQLGERAKQLDLSSEALAPEVLNGLVERIVLTQRADALSLSVSDLAIKRWIAQLPQFQQDGQFSEEIFRRMLSRNGYSPQSFIVEVKKDYVLRQLQQGIAESFFMTDSEISQLVALQEQARSFEYALLKPERFLSAVEVEEGDLRTYYDANTDQFRTQEKAKFDYLLVNAEQLAADVEVTEADIEKAYEAAVKRAESNEQRRASHILISPEIADAQAPADDDNADASSENAPKTAAQIADDLAFEKIKEIQKSIEAGEDFAALAEANSMDPGSATQGGDLGFATRGTMVPAFDEALFELEAGEVSEIVKTDFGYHIIKLAEIKAAEKPVLADIREQLVADIKSEKARTLFEEQVDTLNGLAFESGDLVPLAERFNLTIERSDWVVRASPTDVFADPNVLKAVFADEVIQDGFNTDAIILAGDDRAIVARLQEHSPSELQPLDVVKDQVTELVSLEKAKKMAAKQGRAAIASLRSGGDKEAVATEYGLEWSEHADIKRMAAALPPPVTQHVFQMARPTESGKSFDGVDFDQGFAVIELQSVADNETELTDSEQYNMRLFISRQLGQMEVQNYLDFHENASDVERNL